MADLRRSKRWAGLQPGDPVQVDGTRLRGASWEFVAHITNGETGEVWVEVVGGRAGDRAHVCRNYACRLPADDADTLSAQLTEELTEDRR